MIENPTEFDILVQKDNKVFRELKQDLLDMRLSLNFASKPDTSDELRKKVVASLNEFVSKSLTTIEGLGL